VGGAVNHIHIISDLHPAVCLADLIKDIKLSSRKMIANRPELFSRFRAWQVGYSSFTYQISARPNLIRYVENQHVHHKSMPYRDELIDLLNENEVEFDEKYLL
jgi:REP element-mobilizing transposase RayT